MRLENVSSDRVESCILVKLAGNFRSVVCYNFLIKLQANYACITFFLFQSIEHTETVY